MYEKLPFGALNKRETWQLDAATLKKLAKREADGVRFALALPWSSYQPSESVILRAHFESREAQQEVRLTHSAELRAWHMRMTLRTIGAIPF